MELWAAIEGLKVLKKNCYVKLYSDSEYVVKGFTEGRVERWRARGWKLNDGKGVKNLDLWKLLVHLVDKRHVEFVWIKGHSGIPGNERADALADAAARSPDKKPDLGYI